LLQILRFIAVLGNLPKKSSNNSFFHIGKYIFFFRKTSKKIYIQYFPKKVIITALLAYSKESKYKKLKQNIMSVLGNI